jgi:hemoglobin-like flavoprotein
MLSDAQVDLIRTSAQHLADANIVATNSFYVNLFKVAPEVRPLFSEDMFAQSEKLWQTIVMIVESVDNLPDIQQALRDLGKRHVAYGAEPAHYVVVTSVLIETISTLMKDEWSEAYQEAWQVALEAVCGVMLEGARHGAN